MLNYRYNLFVILRTAFGTLLYTDWQIAYRRRGLWGVVQAFFGALVGLNAWPFFVRADGMWTPERIADRLRARGVVGWGWGYHKGEYFFRVRLRQAHWAQYLLMEQGVPLTGRLLDEPVDGMWRGVGRRAGGRQELGWGSTHAATAHGLAERARQHTAANAASARDPLDAIDRVVDKLAGL